MTSIENPLSDTTLPDTTPSELDEILAASQEAFTQWSATSPEDRAKALATIADALDQADTKLIALADAETHLGSARLTGELARTTFQLRLFAGTATDRGYLDARIDHADADWPMGARPDTRRIGLPLGPVLVFAASNFPFAFSVAGGDTASALAAGCTVVLKAHPGHPRLSALTAELVHDALSAAGAPEGTFALICGVDAGADALADPRISAGAFTGSLGAGRALFDIACRRPVPIPFFAEMGAVNPVFVTASAARLRPEQIAGEFVASFTQGAGQFCTNPGVILIPADSALPGLLAGAEYPPAAPMLNDRIESGFTAKLSELAAVPSVSVIHGDPQDPGTPPSPTLLTATVEDLLADPSALTGEVFGPSSLVVTYTDESQMAQVAEAIEGQLTATIIGEVDDAIAPELVRLLSARVGRLLWNQWPTGLSVTWAQQHGGPYPATTAPSTTSVGMAAITRFIRPVAYQNLPQTLLPPELRDGPVAGPTRVDGTSVLPG